MITIIYLNTGFPVAFLISSNVNTSVVKVFLEVTKNHMGRVQAHVFMRDDDAMVRSAWDATMSGETHVQHIRLQLAHI